MNRRVIGIGETVLDIIFKNDEPQTAIPGGSTFNSIISLGKAGAQCIMVTEIGDDHIGDMICNYLIKNGVSTEYVCHHKGIKSHLSLAFLNENNDAQYVFYKDHASVTLDNKTPDFRPTDIVLFGSFFAINPTIRPKVREMLLSAHNAGAWLYYDINFRKTHIPDIPQVMSNIEENMRLATLVRGSMEDFAYLYNLQDTDAIYERVRPFCPNLILTDGANGILFYTTKGCRHYPVRKITTVSTVGAGDNFNAGFIYALLHDITSQDVRIDMAQRWSQDVCQQIGNNISDELVEQLKQR
ncbi:MAG: carbohydrate kinase [Paludibacteraceae bacterium]|nr:carbohydrate kinase [Paludibacteraceae bacterium]